MNYIFKVKGVEYSIDKNVGSSRPTIVRTDGISIDNRKDVCRMFLLLNGWNPDDFVGKNTHDLERQVFQLLGGEPQSRIKKEKQRGQKTNVNIPNPSIDEVKKWLDNWEQLEDYSKQEDAVNRVFADYNSNNNLENILIKCSILNDFYSTNIYKIYPVAKHILNLNIDDRLKSIDLSLVNEIAQVEINGRHFNFYSFASKYCSHHNQIEYPIYDSYVHKVLVYFRKLDNFYNFKEDDLKNYKVFKNILIAFRKYYKLEQFNLKEIDKFLWQFGKEYFKKSY